MRDVTPGVDGDAASIFARWCFLLGIVFVVLKVTGTIAWSWVWVLAPFWLPLVSLFILIFVLAILVAITGEK